MLSNGRKRAPLPPMLCCFVFFSLNEKNITIVSGETEAHARQGNGKRKLNMVETQTSDRDRPTGGKLAPHSKSTCEMGIITETIP